MRIDPDKVPSTIREAANAALQCFASDTWLVFRGMYVTVCWRRRNGELFARRWMTRGQDFYPTWYRHWGHGGTATTALSQLVRWIQAKPVLPLSTWKYWSAPNVNLFRDRGDEVISVLSAADYPESVDCVLCREPITGGLDWWRLDGVSGPCCSIRSGCRQSGKRSEELVSQTKED